VFAQSPPLQHHDDRILQVCRTDFWLNVSAQSGPQKKKKKKLGIVEKDLAGLSKQQPNPKYLSLTAPRGRQYWGKSTAEEGVAF
jgi:hypothetical protein